MRMLCHFFRADADYGMRVMSKLSLPEAAAQEAIAIVRQGAHPVSA